MSINLLSISDDVISNVLLRYFNTFEILSIQNICKLFYNLINIKFLNTNESIYHLWYYLFIRDNIDWIHNYSKYFKNFGKWNHDSFDLTLINNINLYQIKQLLYYLIPNGIHFQFEKFQKYSKKNISNITIDIPQDIQEFSCYSGVDRYCQNVASNKVKFICDILIQNDKYIKNNLMNINNFNVSISSIQVIHLACSNINDHHVKMVCDMYNVYVLIV